MRTVTTCRSYADPCSSVVRIGRCEARAYVVVENRWVKVLK